MLEEIMVDGVVVSRRHLHEWIVLERADGTPCRVVCNNELCPEEFEVQV